MLQEPNHCVTLETWKQLGNLAWARATCYNCDTQEGATDDREATANACFTPRCSDTGSPHRASFLSPGLDVLTYLLTTEPVGLSSQDQGPSDFSGEEKSYLSGQPSCLATTTAPPETRALLVVSIFRSSPRPLAWNGTPALLFSCWAVSVAMRIKATRSRSFRASQPIKQL